MKKSILSVILITCLLMSLIPTVITAATTHSTVSGIISLPGNEKAPDGGVKITLSIGTDNLTPANKNDDKLITQSLTIAKGQHSISYSVMVPKSTNSKAKYSVAYTVESRYAPFGWYSTKGTTAVKQDRSQIDVNAGDVGNVDITLLKGITLSGKIIAGNQTTAPANNMNFTVTAIQEGKTAGTSDDDIIITKNVTLKKDHKEADWSVIVPPSAAGKGYKVYYSYADGTYTEAGYYHVDGTSRSENNATLIFADDSVTGIHLTTLPFTNLFGRISLPDKEKAPAKGIEAVITAENLMASGAKDDFRISKTVVIPKNANYVDYDITVPVKKTGYTVSYKVNKNTGYITEGYYGKKETQSAKSKAALVSTDNRNVTGIDLTLLKYAAPTITPTPTPKPAPGKTPDPKYDLNEDGKVNLLDMVELAKVIAAQYKNPGYKDDCKLSDADKKAIREAFKPFDNNRYQFKFFNSFNQWFRGWDWDFDFDDFNDFKDIGKWNNGNGNKNKKK